MPKRPRLIASLHLFEFLNCLIDLLDPGYIFLCVGKKSPEDQKHGKSQKENSLHFPTYIEGIKDWQLKQSDLNLPEYDPFFISFDCLIYSPLWIGNCSQRTPCKSKKRGL